MTKDKLQRVIQYLNVLYQVLYILTNVEYIHKRRNNKISRKQRLHKLHSISLFMK